MRRWDIHVLRAVAIASVFGYHTGIPNLGSGSLGVDVFFVLSGYLITIALLRIERWDLRALGTFYRHRAARTVPAALAAILAIVLLVSLVAPDEWAGMRWHLAASAAWSENVLMAVVSAGDMPGVPALTPFTHYWSLAMEEQFYLVWPWVLGAVVVAAARSRQLARQLGVSAILLVLVGWSLHLYVSWGQTAQPLAYFSPVARVWQLGVGALVAVWLPTLVPVRQVPRWGRVVAVVGFLAGVVVLFTCFARRGFPHDADSPWWAITVVATTALLVATGRGLPGLHPAARRVLVPVLWLGTISYGLYLWHLPVLWVLSRSTVEQRSLPWWLVVVACSFGAATLSWHLIERPSVRWARARDRQVATKAPATPIASPNPRPGVTVPCSALPPEDPGRLAPPRRSASASLADSRAS